MQIAIRIEANNSLIHHRIKILIEKLCNFTANCPIKFIGFGCGITEGRIIGFKQTPPVINYFQYGAKFCGVTSSSHFSYLSNTLDKSSKATLDSARTMLLDTASLASAHSLSANSLIALTTSFILRRDSIYCPHFLLLFYYICCLGGSTSILDLLSTSFVPQR